MNDPRNRIGHLSPDQGSLGERLDDLDGSADWDATDWDTRFTAQEYAKAHGVSVSTARRRLDKLRAEGLATVFVGWEQAEPKLLVGYGCQTPPPHKVVSYVLKRTP